jgi:hypothetical protein
MNLLEAELHRDSDGLRVCFGPHGIRVDQTLVESRPRLLDYDGHRVILGIRPQKTADAALMDAGDIECTIAATVELREDLGSEVDVHVAIGAPTAASSHGSVLIPRRAWVAR